MLSMKWVAASISYQSPMFSGSVTVTPPGKVRVLPLLMDLPVRD
jgi:hypothetical protein